MKRPFPHRSPSVRVARGPHDYTPADHWGEEGAMFGYLSAAVVVSLLRTTFVVQLTACRLRVTHVVVRRRPVGAIGAEMPRVCSLPLAPLRCHLSLLPSSGRHPDLSASRPVLQGRPQSRLDRLLEGFMATQFSGDRSPAWTGSTALSCETSLASPQTTLVSLQAVLHTA